MYSISPVFPNAAVLLRGDTLYLFYSAVGDTSERILFVTFDMSRPWPGWWHSHPEIVFEPELEWEGADLPLVPSCFGLARARVRQLRDPGIHEEDGRCTCSTR